MMDIATALLSVAGVAVLVAAIIFAGYWGLSIVSRCPEDDE